MILHLDLDCFFAAAHRINNPQLDNIPIAVGGRSNLSIFDRDTQKRELSKIDGAFTSSILSVSDNTKSFKEYFQDEDGKIRGIITTSSYEARAFGVKTAMSVAEALRYCPHLIVLPPNYSLYHKLSYELKLLLEKEIPTIEQFSVDEFFGDVTGWIDDEKVFEFAKDLQYKIFQELKLPISIGVAKTKWIAKLATNDAKPNGVKVIYPNEVLEYIKDKPVSEFCGVGHGYQNRLQKYSIKTLGEVKNKKYLFDSWGKFGKQLYKRILGEDDEVLSLEKNLSKSIGLGRTFDPLSDRDEIKRRLVILCRHLSFLSFKNSYNPSTYSLKIKYQYGEKSKGAINTKRTFAEQLFKLKIVQLFHELDKHPSHSIIQINITLYNFTNRANSSNLFTREEDQKQIKLNDSINALREKFGLDIIKSGGEL